VDDSLLGWNYLVVVSVASTTPSRFQTSDNTIATVDTTTGVVTGIHSGTVTITAFAAHYHVTAPMNVQVR